ncbi:MAG TPA: hypothetical protein VFM80_01485 [Gracilimonas sp.]|uniref:hypothetical protein n=1 Tax=Gracilimonas sp. TaxID=1974203 RepID=UPI002DAB77D5|nr:hypothetical protein [Gracilimonas sp.]
MKYSVFALFLLVPFVLLAQQSSADVFWETLSAQCGKAFIGEVLEAPVDDDFRNHELVMHILSCDDKVINIPFFVGDDRSRTWILTRKGDRIELKHDHRHEDGTEDEVTMYGGTSTSTGLETLQTFPADQETADLIPAAASNIWWIEVVPDEYYTYNLRRIGTDRYFSIRFSFEDETEIPPPAWGWE